ncbi:MAG: HesA/MoeB/ThiF family protein [Arachnia sp.]
MPALVTPLPPLVDEGPQLSPAQRARHQRTIDVQEIGMSGQRRLAGARVAVVGAGGLGGPVLSYLAGAGVGRLTVLDDDVVEERNLQRQLLYATSSIGESKAEAAAARLRDLNPGVEVSSVRERVTEDSAAELLSGHDLIVDAVDNLPTRYALSDAAASLDLPVVWGAVQATRGQVSVFWARYRLTLRSVFPEPPATMPSVDDVGVLGPMTGVVGSLMACECVKLITGVGQSLLGRLLYVDTLGARFAEIELGGQHA